MKVFISWSGELSRQIAESLKKFLKYVVQATDPWISSQDIEPGAMWFSEITDQLEGTSVGIICLTTENLESPWIHFEAGALLKGLRKNRVCTLLIGLKTSDLEEPLSKFNGTVVASKDDMFKLVETINKQLDEKTALPKEVLRVTFEQFWPEFYGSMKKTLDDYKPIAPRVRNVDELVEEILLITRQTQSSVETLRQEQKFEKETREAATRWVRSLEEGVYGKGLGMPGISGALNHLDYIQKPLTSVKISTTPQAEAPKPDLGNLYE